MRQHTHIVKFVFFGVFLFSFQQCKTQSTQKEIGKNTSEQTIPITTPQKAAQAVQEAMQTFKSSPNPCLGLDDSTCQILQDSANTILQANTEQVAQGMNPEAIASAQQVISPTSAHTDSESNANSSTDTGTEVNQVQKSAPSNHNQAYLIGGILLAAVGVAVGIGDWVSYKRELVKNEKDLKSFQDQINTIRNDINGGARYASDLFKPYIKSLKYIEPGKFHVIYQPARNNMDGHVIEKDLSIEKIKKLFKSYPDSHGGIAMLGKQKAPVNSFTRQKIAGGISGILVTAGLASSIYGVVSMSSGAGLAEGTDSTPVNQLIQTLSVIGQQIQEFPKSGQ